MMIRNIKIYSLIVAMTATVALAGCFKKVSYDTTFLIKPNLQAESGSALTAAPGAEAYAWFNRTEQWAVESYDDAVAGVLTDTDTGDTERVAPDAAAVATDDGLLELATRSRSVLLVAIYPEARMYAWRIFETSENASPTYLTLQFRPWKTEAYVDSGWNVGVDITEEPDNQQQ